MTVVGDSHKEPADEGLQLSWGFAGEDREAHAASGVVLDVEATESFAGLVAPEESRRVRYGEERR